MDGDEGGASDDPGFAGSFGVPEDPPKLPPLNQPGGVPERFGDYEVDRLIARGTHGVVFKGTDVHGLRVAIKWLRMRQNDSELDALVQLSKTVNGLPPILSSGTKDDRTYFVMPYYERRSLRFRLRKLPFPQPINEVVRMAGAVTDVLGELHRHGYTHADFKPDNVLLESLPASSDRSQHVLLRDDERLVLTDFGTIRSADGAVQFGEGTLGYAAPELLTTVIDHDPRVDIYAASATLVECMSGVTPEQVRGPLDSAFDDEVLRSTGPLESALRKGLSFDPQYRHETISAWFDAILTAAQAVEPFTTESDPHQHVAAAPEVREPYRAGDESRPADSGATEGRRSKTRIVSAVAALVALAAVAFWGLTRGQTTPSPTAQPADISSDDDTSSDAGSDAGGQVTSRTDPSGPTSTASNVAGAGLVGSELNPAVPALFEMTPDPAWGTPRRHLTAVSSETEQPGQSDGARYHNVETTSRPVVSENERWILAKRDEDWTIVDRSNGDYRILNLEPESLPTWHPTEPETILHLDVEGFALLATPIDGPTATVVDLGDRISAELPDATFLIAPEHGEPSADGTRFAWAVANGAGEAVAFITYDLAADRVLGMKIGNPEGDIGRFDSIAISKTGDKVVVAFEQAYVIYDSDFTNERRINQRPFSYELALSGGGQDVLVVANFENGTFGTGWIVNHNLDEGTSSQLLDLYDGSNSNVQISGLATEKPGWVLVSTHDCADQESWSCDRIMAMNVDDATIINLAETNSCANDLFAVPTGVVNRDFTKAWFNTDFGSCGQDGTIVELAIDQLDQLDE